MKTSFKKIIAGGLVAALCFLSGCSGTAPDHREDPLAGHNVDALLPFPTRLSGAEATSAPTAQPQSTDIVSLPQNWQNESAPQGDQSTVRPAATPAPAATRVTYNFTRLEQGNEGEEVLRLQNRLKELGYLTGNPDGKFGANTKNAVKLFQKALGLSQTGVATVSLQEKLFISSAPVYVPSGTSAPADNAASVYPALVRGDKNTDVQKMQNRLIELGYLTGTADGVFGANTETAVRAFQAQLGLSQTGVASASMQAQLYSASAPYAPVQVTAPPTKAPTQPPKDVTIEYQQLEPGDSGEDVSRMQNRLKSLGYFTGNVTGKYYKETTTAVQRFQQAAGLSQTGIASSATLTRLYAANAPAYSGDAIQPEPTSAGYTTLQRGSKGTEVLNLQKRLRELGYLSSAADGDFGGATETAVRLFQSAVGHEQNGVASVGLQNLLFSANAPVYVPVATSAPAPVPTQIPSSPAYPQLQPGNTGDAVKQLQTRLKELGFFSGLIGGNYLTKTTDAVKLFQAAIGHAETGIATSEMQAILFSANAPTYESVESDYVDLEKNDSGIQVLYLQQRLKELGYLTGAADGDFGGMTEKAVSAFQQQIGLPITGKATAETQEVLFSSNAPYAPAATQAPAVPTQAPTQAPQQQPESGAYKEYSSGNSGEGVKNIQRRLMELGYYEGEIGGNYLARTETAVRLFQAAIGYNQDGVATSSLQSLLFSESAPAYDGRTFTLLRSGDKGLAVRKLQQKLIDLGYLTGTADGDFGGGTEKAIKRYQSDMNLTQNGIASAELQQMLFSASSAPVQPQAPTVTNPPVQEDDSPRDLSYGDSGAQVKALQNRLKELGYLTGTADGDFGGATRSAVQRFQQAVNYYTQDGAATIELQQLLFASNAPAYSEPENEPEDGEDLRTIVSGNSGEDVKAIQRRLKELGYFDGDIGGNYLTKTQTAVKLFQETIGRPADGIATPEIQRLILSPDAPVYGAQGQEPPVNPEKPAQLTVLTRGDTGSHVKSLQQRLIYLGWLVGEADGDFGSATENALFAFQYRMGLVTDGVASIEAQELLYDETAPAFVQYFDLLPGAEGEEVLAMQMRLIELGYLEDKEYNTDGIYGNGLMNALINLQIASGTLPELADGIATVDLQTFLFSENAVLYAILPEN